jgi:hypothetical protein
MKKRKIAAKNSTGSMLVALTAAAELMSQDYCS